MYINHSVFSQFINSTANTRDMEKEITYSEVGVDRNLRAASKASLSDLGYSNEIERIKLPYNTIYPIGENKYQDHVIEGIGTKVLFAQLANKFDTIGIDAVAMTVNDIIRSGAKPISLTDNIDIHKSEAALIGKLLKGIEEGTRQAEVNIVGGEIADVKELITGISENPFHIICSCVGQMEKKDIIWGNNLEFDDVIIGLRSSGLHSNGISLARKILFKKWGGKYKPFDIPDGFDRELIYEALEPTKIYVEPVMRVAKKYGIKAAVHITGDAYLKFDKLMEGNKNIGFEFNNFRPQPIFQLIKDTATHLNKKLTDKELFKTFNLGWGFSLIVSKDDKDDVLDCIEKNNRVEADIIGRINFSGYITASFNGSKIRLK